MIISITGSISLKEYPDVINGFLRCSSEVTLGDADGIDKIIILFCRVNQIKFNILAMPLSISNALFGITEQFTQDDYKKRDMEIINHGDMLIALWDGQSQSVEWNIKYANAKNKPMIIYNDKDKKIYTFHMDKLSQDNKDGVKAIFNHFKGSYEFGNEFILEDKNFFDRLIL